MLILYLHKSHTSPLLPPKNICIGIVLDFFWDIFMSQEKLQTTIMQKRCSMGFVQVENRKKNEQVWRRKERMALRKNLEYRG